MEFRRSTPERRQDRRICSRCQIPSGSNKTCAQCGKQTKPRIQIVWYVDGKRHRELTYCWQESEAAKVLCRKETDYWRAQEFGVARDIGGTLKQAYEAFKVQFGATSIDYRRQIDNAINPLARGVGWNRPVPEISSQDLEQYKADGLASRSSATMRSYMMVLRRFFNFLHQEGWIRRNPMFKIKLPKARARKDCLRPTEVSRVLDIFWDVAPAIAPIAATLALSGMRKGEVINLRWEDVDLHAGWAYVLEFEGDAVTEAWKPKTESSSRAVALHPVLIEVLRRVERIERPDGRPSPWVFPVTDKRKLKRVTDARGRSQGVLGERRAPGTSFFGDKLRVALDAAGVERRITIHGLRRTFAVLLQETGAPDAIIQQALGHKPRGVTAIHYLPRRDETVKRWVDKVEISLAAVELPGAPAPIDTPVDTPVDLPISASSPARSGQKTAVHCHQSATKTVAKEPPRLYLVE